MIKIFRKTPREGRPISTIGFADGLRKMAYAWENLSMRGGHIEWSCWGAPTIVVDPASISDVLKEGESGEGGLPDGTEIWGRVAYDQTDNKFVQYKLIWDAATRTFSESETATDIISAESHASQHI